MVDLKYGGPN